MPRYDYQCAACGRRFEVVHGITEDGPTTCPLCGEGPVRKAFAPPAIHFKGSGWAKKERRATAAPGASKASDGDAVAASSGADKGDAKATDGASSSSTSASTSSSASTGSSTD